MIADAPTPKTIIKLDANRVGPNHNDDAERAYIAAILYHESIPPDAQVRPKLLRFQHIYDAALDLVTRGEVTDPIAVKDELVKRNLWADVSQDNEYFLIDLATEGAERQRGVGTYANIMRENERLQRWDDLHGKETTARTKLDWAAAQKYALEKLALYEDRSAEAASTATRFEPLTYDDLKDMPPVAYLDTRQELVKNGFNVLYARRGAGKSFVALDYALTRAQDMPVAYFAGEGISGFPDRIAAWMHQHRKPAGQFKFFRTVPKMLNTEDVDALIAVLKPMKPALIVLDTLARCMAGHDENNTADMSLFVEACDRLRGETGAALLVIHHTGKVANGTRGSIVLEDAADMVIELTNEDGVIKLACDKAKDSEPFEPRYLRLMQTDARPGNRSCVIMPSEQIVQTIGDKLTPSQFKLLETLNLAIFVETGARNSAVIKTSGVPEGSVNRVLSQLLKLGYIRQSKTGDPYFITDMGKRKLAQFTSTPKSNQSLSLSNHDSSDSSVQPSLKSNQSLSHPLRGDSDDSDSECTPIVGSIVPKTSASVDTPYTPDELVEAADRSGLSDLRVESLRKELSGGQPIKPISGRELYDTWEWLSKYEPGNDTRFNRGLPPALAERMAKHL